MIKKDEYNYIYEQYEGSGFEFEYNKRLGKSKPIFRQEVNKINPAKRNDDDIPLFVKCKGCGEYMDFNAGKSGNLDGSWICQSCGAKVRERTVYNQLERENDEFISDFEDGEEPEVCEACGGPWPECEPGCRLFRD